MKRIFIAALCCFLAFPCAQSRAAGIKYYQDPLYVKVNKDEPHPLEDLIALADQGDVRSQFILADLYGKGKGGLGKNHVLARYWFETAARHGYTPSFIRLAALAKHASEDIEAYQWYTLDAEHGAGKEAKWSTSARAQLVKDADLSHDDVREGEKAAKEWLAAQTAAMKEITKREEAAKVAAAAAAATAAPGTAPEAGEKDVGEKDTGDTEEAEKTAAKEQPKQKQEYRYNE